MPHYVGYWHKDFSAWFAQAAAFKPYQRRKPIYWPPVGMTVRFANTNADDKQKRKEEGTLCTRCGGTGYKGRVGTYELMKMNRAIREAIKQGKTTHEIELIAQESGMLTLKKYAVDLITKQLTTISELQKICNTDD